MVEKKSGQTIKLVSAIVAIVLSLGALIYFYIGAYNETGNDAVGAIGNMLMGSSAIYVYPFLIALIISMVFTVIRAKQVLATST